MVPGVIEALNQAQETVVALLSPVRSDEGDHDGVVGDAGVLPRRRPWAASG